MVNGPMGLPRPFVEEAESAMVLIFEYSNIYDTEEMRNIAQSMVINIEDKGILVDQSEVDVAPDSMLVAYDLVRTNIDFEELEDLREIAMEHKGYKNMITSSVPPDQIMRLYKG